MTDVDQIYSLLAQMSVPHTSLSVADIAEVTERGVVLKVGYPIAQVQDAIAEDIRQQLKQKGCEISVIAEQDIPSLQPQNSTQKVSGVKNIIAVASGKGGVGKSTTSVNLALALAHEGATVGILDADIYGPSQPQMLGVANQRPEVLPNNTIKPIRALGVQMVSMGVLVNENTPMIWRGPMVSGALQQLLNSTHWQDVDYLIVDMPPGTGDIQLTLSQSVPVSTSIVVTTPQDIALLDAKKGIEMFRKVNIPVSGIVENMSTHTCSNCGHKEAIFGEQGGQRLAQEYETELLGQLPLTMAIREQVDSGLPPVAADPNSDISLEYRSIAAKLAADIWLRSRENTAPEISFADD